MGHREPRVAQQPEVGGVDVAAADTASASATSFTAQGPIPAVGNGAIAAGPTASDRAFGAGTSVRVTASGLNVRQNPQVADGNIIGGLHHGEQIEVIGSEGGWVNVRYHGKTGYVSGDWVEPVKADAPKAEPASAAPAPSPHDAAPAHHDAAPAPHKDAAPTAPAHHDAAPAAPAHHDAPKAQAAAAPTIKPEQEKAPDDGGALRSEMDAVVGMFEAGAISHDQAVAQFEAFDKAIHGGASSMQAVTMLPVLFGKLGKHAQAQAAQAQKATPPAPAPAPVAPAPAQDAPAPKHDAAAPQTKDATTEHTAWVPPPGAKLDDPKLQALAAKTGGKVDAIVPKLAGVLELDKELRKGRDGSSYYEVHGAKREQMVAGIGAVRAELATLDTSDPSVAAFVLEVNHRMEAVAPYHFQLNMKTVESAGGWSTCNFTSVAMALETVGISAANYNSSKHATIQAVANVFKNDIKGARLASHGNGVSMAELQGLRLPDFMQLAAIVHALGAAEANEQNIRAAATQVVGDKKWMDRVINVVQDFGASASAAPVSFDADKKKNANLRDQLSNYGEQHRGEHLKDQKVEHLNTLRNQAMHETDEKKKAALEKQIADLEHSQHDALAGVGIEDKLSLATYKAAVTRDLGKHIDAGKGVLAGLYNHWTKLYAVEESGVRVQDPGQYNRSEMFITWEEARAMGYFWTNWVVQ